MRLIWIKQEWLNKHGRQRRRNKEAQRKRQDFAEGRPQNLTRFMESDGGNQRVRAANRRSAQTNRPPFPRRRRLWSANVINNGGYKC